MHAEPHPHLMKNKRNARPATTRKYFPSLNRDKKKQQRSCISNPQTRGAMGMPNRACGSQPPEYKSIPRNPPAYSSRPALIFHITRDLVTPREERETRAGRQAQAHPTG